eukprot:COSAG04_NODE_596_length_12255_cov_4.614018_7_plen_259_part_00
MRRRTCAWVRLIGSAAAAAVGSSPAHFSDMSPPGREPAAHKHHQSGCSRALVGSLTGVTQMRVRLTCVRRTKTLLEVPNSHLCHADHLEISAWPAPAPTGSFREHLRSDLAPRALVVWAPAQHPRASSPRSSPGDRSAAAVSRDGSGRLLSNPRPGRSALVLPGRGPMRSVSSPPFPPEQWQKWDTWTLSSSPSIPVWFAETPIFAMPARPPTSAREHRPLGALRGSQGSDAPRPSPGAVVVASRRGWSLSRRSRGEQ